MQVAILVTRRRDVEGDGGGRDEDGEDARRHAVGAREQPHEEEHRGDRGQLDLDARARPLAIEHAQRHRQRRQQQRQRPQPARARRQPGDRVDALDDDDERQHEHEREQAAERGGDEADDERVGDAGVRAPHQQRVDGEGERRHDDGEAEHERRDARDELARQDAADEGAAGGAQPADGGPVVEHRAAAAAQRFYPRARPIDIGYPADIQRRVEGWAGTSRRRARTNQACAGDSMSASK